MLPDNTAMRADKDRFGGYKAERTESGELYLRKGKVWMKTKQELS